MMYRSETPINTVKRMLSAMLEDPSSCAALSPRELDLALRVARRARLLGYLAYRVRESGRMNALPQAATEQLESAMVDGEARTRIVSWEMNRIGWALQGLVETPLVLLKGAAYLTLGLPNATGRLLSDLDLLVPESALGEIESGLTSRGWQFGELTPYDDQYYRIWSHELPPMRHVEREIEVDLHHTILQPTSRLRPPAELLFKDIRRVPGSPFFVLSSTDMVLHAMTHLFFDGDMGDALRDLLDIDLMLRHFAANEEGFWDRFWSRAAQLDLARPAFYGLRYSSRLLGTPVPESTIRDASAGAPPVPVLRLMDFLIPRALFPQHPDAPSRWSSFARLLLYIRSHWIRMPPLMLARHLSVKLYRRHLEPRFPKWRNRGKRTAAGFR